jgi:hypothetical protein
MDGWVSGHWEEKRVERRAAVYAGRREGRAGWLEASLRVLMADADADADVM